MRQEVIASCWRTQVLPATLRLAAYAVRGGRARDIVATLDALVEDAARARGWRVARVRCRRPRWATTQQRELSEALGDAGRQPGRPAGDRRPALLGGVVVQVGDLLVDSSTRHRLDELKEHSRRRGPSEPDRVPQGREATDG